MPRRNPTEPTGELKLNGETFTLFFDFNAVAEVEDQTGIPIILGLSAREVAAPRVSLVRVMLWACLRPKHSDITREQASAMVTQKTTKEVWRCVLEAWSASMTEQEEAADDPLKGQS